MTGRKTAWGEQEAKEWRDAWRAPEFQVPGFEFSSEVDSLADVCGGRFWWAGTIDALGRMGFAADGFDLLHDRRLLYGDIAFFGDIGGEVVELPGGGWPRLDGFPIAPADGKFIGTLLCVG